MSANPHSKYFDTCLELAEKAGLKNEVPIAAILVREGKIIASASNETESENSFLAHAELQVIREASRVLQSKYLKGCELYVTLEPCLMCLTAARLARIDAIHYLVASEKFGEDGPAYHPIRTEVHEGEQSEKSKSLLRRFFQTRR